MTAPTIVGVDLSITATGIWLGGGVTVRTNAADPIELRLLSIRRAVLAAAPLGFVPHGGVVALEDFVTKSPAASVLGMVHGIVRVALVEAGVPFVLVPPSSLKKYITGKGNADKATMRMETYKRFGIDIADDNQCDAFGLRVMALDAYGHPLADLPAAQRDALEKVAWPSLGSAAA